MIYKQFHDLQLSTLGMGNMRLPTVGERGPIDEKSAGEIIDYAYENGVNYFDTAYGYHMGESEKFIGKALSRYPRKSWYLATKMPGHMMRYNNNRIEFSGYLTGLYKDSVAQVFEEQLEKCSVDYFDFYLLHNLCETAYDFYTDEDLGVVEYLLEQKKLGRIKHLGFSAHGRPETIENFINWNNCFEFAQIQLNYMDWTLQDAGKKYDVLTNHGIPVIVMEPCRGGQLANIEGKAGDILKSARPNDSIVSWAFRFLQSLENVQVVLSGMSTLDQLKENIALFSKIDPLADSEKDVLRQIVSMMADIVPCTACRYCVDGCPKNLNIPKLLSMYNEIRFDNPFVLKFTLDAMTEAERPGACVECGGCKEICPQNIDIPILMKRFDEAIDNMA